MASEVFNQLEEKLLWRGRRKEMYARGLRRDIDQEAWIRAHARGAAAVEERDTEWAARKVWCESGVGWATKDFDPERLRDSEMEMLGAAEIDDDDRLVEVEETESRADAILAAISGGSYRDLGRRWGCSPSTAHARVERMLTAMEAARDCGQKELGLGGGEIGGAGNQDLPGREKPKAGARQQPLETVREQAEFAF